MAQWAKGTCSQLRGLQFGARKPCSGEGTGSTKLSSDLDTSTLMCLRISTPSQSQDGSFCPTSPLTTRFLPLQLCLCCSVCLDYFRVSFPLFRPWAANRLCSPGWIQICNLSASASRSVGVVSMNYRIWLKYHFCKSLYWRYFKESNNSKKKNKLKIKCMVTVY